MHLSVWDLTLVKEYKEKRPEDGISRKRPLKNARIDAVQNFFGHEMCDIRYY